MNLSSVSSRSTSIPRGVPSSAIPIRRSPPLRIDKRSDRLEDGVCHDLVILAVFLEIPPESRLEFECLRLALPKQLFGVAVGAQVLVEEIVL